MQTSQEHFTTIAYAKFGGKTEWIMGNWKIENEQLSPFFKNYFLLSKLSMGQIDIVHMQGKSWTKTNVK